ncbi:MAG: hypothetical protein ACI9RI_000866 [Oceanospirillaceae bacterium]|jgi:hypothetical protein
MNKEDVLITASNLISGQRADDYGSLEDNFGRIAAMWGVILGNDVSTEQVALCMAAVKMCRLVNTPDHADSWVDLAGYAAIGSELAG